MPGVPSGRGCDACRQQKKKCDQRKPVCSRCIRCKIACTGAGQQRYKFKEHKVVVRSTGLQQPKASLAPLRGLPQSPSNETTAIASAFIFALEVKDPRYDLSCYGEFLEEIPKRLGSNIALDASVDVLTSAFSSLYTHQRSLTTLSKYVNALKTLRTCLDDPLQAPTAHTLCAIYLLMICQGWIGRREDDHISHGAGGARLLSAAASRTWKTEFEIKILLTLCVPVIFESIINPKIQLHPWLDTLIAAPAPERAARGHFEPAGRKLSMMRMLARIPDFVRHPALYLSEVKWRYPHLKADCQTVRTRLAKMSELVFSSQVDPSTMTMYARGQAFYGVALTIATILNGILRAFDPCGTSLAEDSASLVDEILTLAERLYPFRPLAASHIPLCLATGWAVTDDMSRKVEIERYLADYQTDLRDFRWLEGATWLKSQYESWGRKTLTAFPKNSLDRCEVDVNDNVCDPNAAEHANSSCGVQ